MVLDLGGSRLERPGRAAAPGKSGSGLLYEQVVEYVEKLVSERGLVPGDLLPTYAELAERVGVSLITVRRALDELERAGKVRRHQGLGTFLARPRILTDPARAGSLLGTLAEGERQRPAETLDTRILDIRRGLPSGDIARALQIRADSQVWQLRRQRMIDGNPAVVETSVIPTSLAPELDRLVSRQNGSLYDLLGREYGLVDEFEEQYLEVIMPTQEERRLLGIASRTHVVRIRGLSLDKAGTPFDCFEQLYPATEFAFAISGSTSRHLLPTPGFQDWDVRSLPASTEEAPALRRPSRVRASRATRSSRSAQPRRSRTSPPTA
jgi:DNA-binding GntR family transcriptional regulator